MIPPWVFLCLLLGITALGAAATFVRRRAMRQALLSLAREWHMRYAPDDRFVLASRVGRGLTTPGSANVVVRDLIYGKHHPKTFKYFFTVEFTLGVLRGKTREVEVGMLIESVDESEPIIHLAPSHLSMLERYRWLRSTESAAPP